MDRGGPSNKIHCHGGRHPIMRAQQGAEESVRVFQSQTPHELHAKMELVEAEARLHRNFIPDDEGDATVGPWIPNMGTSITRKTK